jgi:ubiquinone/menaquinone biosynthesis C-methylase UbiE
VKQYYDARAPEYDEWYLGQGRFEGLDRPDWEAAVRALQDAIARLPRANTLDVACGTGFLTEHLPGEITALDQSERMLAVARERAPHATLIQGDALDLPFADDSFERVFTGHFYGHLEETERQTRILNDGSRFTVYKRYFDADQLAEELSGGTIIHDSPWFVAVVTRARGGHR